VRAARNRTPLPSLGGCAHRRVAYATPRMGSRRRNVKVPLWRWAFWLVLLLLADLVFYVLLTPLWLGLRVAAQWSDRRTGRA